MAQPPKKPPKEVKSFIDALSEAKEVELRNVEVLAEEFIVSLMPQLAQVVPPSVYQAQVHLEEALKLLRQTLGIPTPPPTPPTPPVAPVPVVEAPPVAELVKAVFKPPTLEYRARIAEVRIGATSSEGGTRSKAIKIGGESAPPFYRFIAPQPYRPVIALDVFDSLPSLPKAIKDHYRDVLKDPVAWAKKCVGEFKADLVTVHLVSTDPKGENRPTSEAISLIKKMLESFDLPFIIGGSGNPEKDSEVFREASKATRGERLVMASVTMDMKVEEVCKPIIENGHNVLSLAFLDINQAKILNRRILDAGVPSDHLITDPSTGALGYGIEYTFSVMERMRLMGLMGDKVLQVPISCAATNAWAAREAWMDVEEWGPREYRGPLWEAVTGLVSMLAGADLFMMLHPIAAVSLKKFAEVLAKPKVETELKKLAYEEWVKARF